jgi:hypothetical protein
MARSRRSFREPQQKLSEAELAELRRVLSEMKEHELRSFYTDAYRRCELHECRFPSPRSIQELVQAWKQLRQRPAQKPTFR